MGFGLGPPASGYAEGTQWRYPPTGHRTSLDVDLDAADGDGERPRPSGPWFRRVFAQIRWLLRKR